MYEMDESTMRKGLKLAFHSILNKLRKESFIKYNKRWLYLMHL